jgi:hypothetical protein
MVVKTADMICSQSQLSYTRLYMPVNVLQDQNPMKANIQIQNPPADLLDCAEDSNKVMKLMQVKVDGKDISSNIVRQSTTQPFIGLCL